MHWFVAVVVSDMCWSWCLLTLTKDVPSLPPQHRPWAHACWPLSWGSVAPTVVSWEAPAPFHSANHFASRTAPPNMLYWHWVMLKNFAATQCNNSYERWQNCVCSVPYTLFFSLSVLLELWPEWYWAVDSHLDLQVYMTNCGVPISIFSHLFLS